MSQSLSAVILAGVHDWGACALNAARLRPLAPIVNRPIVEHVIRALSDAGVRSAVVCANGHAQDMRGVLGDRVRDTPLLYHDDVMPRGPAGCIRDAAAALPESVIVVAEGTMVPHFDIHELIVSHLRTGAALTVAARWTVVAGEQSYSPAGMYVVSPHAIEHIAATGFVDIKESWIPRLHKGGYRVDVHPIDGVAPRVHGVASYFAVNDWAAAAAGTGVWELEGYGVDRSTLRHIDARIDGGAQLLGPVIVGPGAIVGRNAIIAGPVTIDQSCVIGEGAIVSRSALWNGAVVGAGAELDRCILADFARIAPGEKLINAVCVADESAHRTARAPRIAESASQSKPAHMPVAAGRTVAK